ncbi:MAG: DUF1049 domain-containing protein [Cyanobacteria bacterium J06632_22]
MIRLGLVLIPASVAVMMAVLSVQNATPVSLTFLTFHSVALPLGLWLGLGLAAGMVGTVLLLGGRRSLL